MNKQERNYPTRMNEVLGVETGQVFYFEGTSGLCQEYVLDAKGHLFRNHKTQRIESSRTMADIINHPERIIRRPRLTEEQILALNAAVKWFGFKWLVKDKCESVCFWQNKPEKRENHWSAYGGGMYADIMTVKVDNLVSWSDPEPLDIVATLKAAGVEVE